MTNQIQITFQPAGFCRRIAAMFYDYLVVLALLIISTMILTPLIHFKIIEPGNVYYQIYLLSIIFLYFTVAWMRGGQTIGMKAWSIILYTMDGKPVKLFHCVLRFFFAIPAVFCGGFGFIWMFFNKNKLAWHDQMSKSKIVMVPDASSKTPHLQTAA